jgi:hypothetical protein
MTGQTQVGATLLAVSMCMHVKSCQAFWLSFEYAAFLPNILRALALLRPPFSSAF